MSVQDMIDRKERPPFVRFEKVAVEDKAASLKAGHYVGKDVDLALVTPPYSKDVMKHKIPQWFEQLEQDVRNERIPPAWVETYRRSYQAWQNGQAIPLNGTPILGWGVISPAIQKTLISMNVLTVEDLAGMNDEGIQRLGMGAVDVCNKAKAWVAQIGDKGPLTMEMAALKGKNAGLESEVEALQKQVKALMAVVGIKENAFVPNDIQAEQAEEISAADLIDNPREELVAQYTAKFGKPPHHRKSDATIRAELG